MSSSKLKNLWVQGDRGGVLPWGDSHHEEGWYERSPHVCGHERSFLSPVLSQPWPKQLTEEIVYLGLTITEGRIHAHHGQEDGRQAGRH